MHWASAFKLGQTPQPNLWQYCLTNGGGMQRLLNWLEARSYGNASKVFAVFLAIGVVAFSAAVINTIMTRQTLNERIGATLPERINTLTDSLKSAAQIISDIEKEIGERQSLVEKLRSDAEAAKSLAQLNNKQVDAVAQVLRGQIDKEQNEGFWFAQATAFFYTILGVVLAEGARLFLRRKPRRP